MSWLFASGGQSIGASASASVLPMTWVYIYLHSMTFSRNSRSSYFPADITGLWAK